ncbi:MAG: iron transporter, partial [Desulfobacteraceae bacterium]
MVPITRTEKMRTAAGIGIRKALRSYLWLLKLLLPISLATALLDYAGWLRKLDFLLEPVMAMLSLPSAAALPILIGMTAGVYGSIAAMAVLPFTVEEMTLITVFVLIAHNLPQEGLIQARSGIPFVKTTLARLAAAVLACLAVAWCLPPAEGSLVNAAAAGYATPLGDFLLTWVVEMLRLGVKILMIIVGVMLAIELMKAFDLIDRCVRLFAPFLKLLGLDQRAGMLWLTGVLFGLAYGG